MKEIKSAKGLRDGKSYYIRRHGGWFRVNAAGYTDDIAQAGIYSHASARGFMQAEGVTAVPVESMREDLWKEVREMLARAAKLSEIAIRL